MFIFIAKKKRDKEINNSSSSSSSILMAYLLYNYDFEEREKKETMKEKRASNLDESL